MKSFNIMEIPNDSFFSKPVHLDPNFILTAVEMPFTVDLAKILVNWDFKEVWSDGEPCEDYIPEGAELQMQAEMSDPNNLATMSDADNIQRAEKFYLEFRKYAENLFNHAGIRIFFRLV